MKVGGVLRSKGKDKAVLTFHVTGYWREGRVKIRWRESTRRVVSEVEEAIERAWEEKAKEPGVMLFDGPMCRMESWEAKGEELHLGLSHTSYKKFWGTNLCHPEWVEQYGQDVMANPVGVSPALVSRDGYLMMGRRNEKVAYYPNRVHPFAGSLEPREGLDVFGEVRRELAEELSLVEGDIKEMACLGIAEDNRIRHPELIFLVRSNRSRREIEAKLDRAEHEGVWSVEATEAPVEAALREEGLLTPIGSATLMLWRGVTGH